MPLQLVGRAVRVDFIWMIDLRRIRIPESYSVSVIERSSFTRSLKRGRIIGHRARRNKNNDVLCPQKNDHDLHQMTHFSDQQRHATGVAMHASWFSCFWFVVCSLFLACRLLVCTTLLGGISSLRVHSTCRERERERVFEHPRSLF